LRARAFAEPALQRIAVVIDAIWVLVFATYLVGTRSPASAVSPSSRAVP